MTPVEVLQLYFLLIAPIVSFTDAELTRLRMVRAPVLGLAHAATRAGATTAAGAHVQPLFQHQFLYHLAYGPLERVQLIFVSRAKLMQLTCNPPSNTEKRRPVG